MKKRIVLCADDYGQAPFISRGIIQLLKAQRLSAVSCMVNQADWLSQAAWLLPYQSQVQIGLHFNLSEGRSVSTGTPLCGLTSLIFKSLFRCLDVQNVTTECLAQLDLFVAAIGRLPQFIDGHQHIHQFPLIREAVIAVYLSRLAPCSAYLRLVAPDFQRHDHFKTKLKKTILFFLGSHSFRRRLARLNIAHNQGFAGLYDFNQPYAALFPLFLQEITDNGIIMCHPAVLADDATHNDPIAEARYKEYEYFMSEVFLADCARAQVSLGMFNPKILA